MNSRIIAILLLFCFFLSTSCNKKDEFDQLPRCILDKIIFLKKQPYPSELWKWEWNSGQGYYLNTADCIDCYHFLYDDNCERICAPDGGFSGGGDGLCPEFINLKQTLIWRHGP